MSIFIRQIPEEPREIFICLFEAQYLKTIAENKQIKIATPPSGDANKNCHQSR